jgi:hypothetical protein
MVKQYRIGFKGKKQSALFMVWVEYWDSMDDNNVQGGRILFSSSWYKSPMDFFKKVFG